jgi:hypothetical protein
VEIGVSSISEAEDVLGTLQGLLASYQLSLNPRKTRISELPEPQEADGIWDLRAWEFSDSARVQARQLVGYFDRLSKGICADRGGTLAAYAIARLQSVTCKAENASLLQDLLLQVLVTEPSCARQVMEMFALQRWGGLTVSSDSFAKAADALILRHAPMGHGSEVAWALWGSITHRVPISEGSARVLQRMEDNFVGLLTLHAREQGLTPQSLDVGAWQSCLTSGQLRGENWLLVYESCVQKWLVPADGRDLCTEDPFFKELRAAGVSFYDKAASPLPPAQAQVSGGSASRSG